MSRPRIIVVAGPTASGKSALALDLAERLGGELVSADSQQVYRGLDVGTAKPDAAERARAPHHLLDVAEPTEQLTAARFVGLADAAIAEVVARGRAPLVVGGTHFWLRALLHGLAEAPPRDEALRARLEALADHEGTPALHARLRQVDPDSAARLHPNDRVRLVRALEVHALTGRPLSELQAAHAFAEARYPHRLLALRLPRELLRARIRDRAAAMLEAGWLEETRAVLAGGLAEEKVLKTLGYGEVLALLRGELTRAEVLDRVAARTWQLAKRQTLWLRREPGVTWLEPPVDVDALAAELGRWLVER